MSLVGHQCPSVMSGTADHRLIGSLLRSPRRIERSSVMAVESICGSAELSGSSGASWVLNRVARHSMRGSTWVDHMQSEGHVTLTRVTWDFRGGGRTTC